MSHELHTPDYVKAFIQVVGALLLASGGVLWIAGCIPTAEAECGIMNANLPIGILLFIIGVFLLAFTETIWFLRFRTRKPTKVSSLAKELKSA